MWLPLNFHADHKSQVLLLSSPVHWGINCSTESVADREPPSPACPPLPSSPFRGCWDLTAQLGYFPTLLATKCTFPFSPILSGHWQFWGDDGAARQREMGSQNQSVGGSCAPVRITAMECRRKWRVNFSHAELLWCWHLHATRRLALFQLEQRRGVPKPRSHSQGVGRWAINSALLDHSGPVFPFKTGTI